MASVYTTGMKLEYPQTGDKGDVFFPILERDIEKINNHTHNGLNAAKISTTDINKATVAIPKESWTAQVNGVWSQEVLIPNDANYADVYIMIKSAPAGEQLFLDVKPVLGQPKKFIVYCNDNNVSATAHILV